MKLNDLMQQIQTLAPLSLAEPWDKVGLQVGDAQQNVRKALLCIDLTPAVVKQAISAKAQLIVSYHPPIFEPLKTLTPGDWKTRALLDCVKHGIAVYSPHTALDAAPQGLNHWLANGLGEGEQRVIKHASPQKQGMLVVFVPLAAANGLREALSQAGAGQIGQYTSCSFGVLGEGTFKGDDRSNPTIGQPGQFERVEELRMEMVFPWAIKDRLVRTLYEHHPYEEPAFNMYELASTVRATQSAGQGRVLTLDKPVTLETLTQRIAKHLGVKHVDVTPAVDKRGRIRTIGLCVGAGGSLLSEAGEIDAFFTGEMRYHDVLAASQRGIHILLAGHVQTERPFLPEYRKMLAATTGSAVNWTVARQK
jgi:dinuclear metal center YbgI/SA1388 family protein